MSINDDFVSTATYGTVESMITLLEKGANIHYKRFEDTALWIAAKENNTKVVEYLINNCNIDAQIDHALFLACRRGRTKIVKMLIDKGADVNVRGKICYDEYGASSGTADIYDADHLSVTALMVASMHGDPEIVQILIDNGADLNNIDSRKNTALIYACKLRLPKIVELLLDSGANINAKGNSGSALKNAHDNGYSDIEKLLTDKGARTSGCFIASVVYDGPIAPEVTALKRFRDDILLRSTIGKQFVSIYYLISPRIATLIGKYAFAKRIGRLMLDPIVLVINIFTEKDNKRW